MKFNYQARTEKGEIQSGAIKASTKEAALALLQRHKLFVTVLEEAGRDPFYSRKIKFLERVSVQDIMLFSRQLSIMFKSKIPLSESLRTLSRQTENLSFRENIVEMAEEVEGGTSFSQTLSRFPKLFSHFYISMVKSGEVSGKLSDALDYLAEHLEKEHHFRSRLIGAILYPVFVLFVFGVVLVLMIFFIVPSLAETLKQSSAELPVITKIVLALSEFLRHYIWFFVFCFIGLFTAIFQYFKTVEGKKTFDRLCLKLPLISPLAKKIYLSRFAENLSTLIAGGLPIAHALEITGEVVGNDIYKNIILEARDEVRKGKSISMVFSKYPAFVPPLVVQMMLVGERTGRLGSALMNIVNFYQKEVDRALDNFIALLEPILIVFLGFVVGGLMLSLLMPLYQVGGL